MGHEAYQKPEKWEEIFSIVPFGTKTGKRGLLTLFGQREESDYKWALVDKRTAEIVGKYQDRLYAIKQARYKYRKIINKIDRILLR